MKIREATINDRKNLVYLMQKADNRTKEWAEERVKSYTNNKNKLILVAENKNNLVGFAGIKRYEDNKARQFANLENFIWLTWIAILPEFRNKKIGSLLLENAEKYINLFDKSGIILDCRKKVLEFYKQAGYQITGIYIHKNSPRFVMSKLK